MTLARNREGLCKFRQVLECASPLALFDTRLIPATGEFNPISASFHRNRKAVEGYRNPRRFAFNGAVG